jgi:hypothetical protein
MIIGSVEKIGRKVEPGSGAIIAARQDWLEVSGYSRRPNPVAAFVESFRVLKEAGTFFGIFPKRDAEKGRDIFRPLSTPEEQIKAYEAYLTVLSSGDAWRCPAATSVCCNR